MGGDEPDIKFSSSVDGHVKKKTKQMDITAAEAEALIPFYLERTVRESTKKQYRSYFIRYKNYCHENSLTCLDSAMIFKLVQNLGSEEF